jgi:Serine dehydrogenase proteinase
MEYDAIILFGKVQWNGWETVMEVTMEQGVEQNKVAVTHSGAAISPPQKTPLYKAMHAERYQRQSQISAIQKLTGNKLLCYVAGKTLVNRDDTLGIVELLHNVPRGLNIDLLLHTNGGDIDAAEKSMSLLRNAVGTGKLRVIVPDFAKSAGTLMALAADSIVMSDSSELGPIDPQITLSDGRGNFIAHSVASYLDAFSEHSEALKKDNSDIIAHTMLNKIDPATLNVFAAAKERARKLAEDHLKQGMKVPNFTAIANAFIDNKRWLTHGQMIGYQSAQQEGLTVEYLLPDNEVWREYWQLYCHLRLSIKDDQKLFESEYASLCL